MVFGKYRVSDPVTGRFLAVDPLASQYPYNSVYAFQENKFGKGIELEGAEAIPFPAIPYIIDGLVATGEFIAGTAIGAAAINWMKSKAKEPGVGQGIQNSTVPLWAQQRGKQLNQSSSAGDYTNVPDPRNAGDGKKTTSSQRKKLLEENKKRNNGKLVSDGDGRELNPPTANEKGKPADMNQAEVDHIKPKAKGGSNKNLRVISKEENLKKGDNEL